jgi:hypothetical protein
VPVVRIHALPQPESIDIAAVLAAVASDLAGLLGEEPNGTWATWQTIEPGRYSEGDDAPTVQPKYTHPPLASIVAFEGRPDELVERMLGCVAESLVRALGLGEGNAFVTYEEAHAGRIFSGGRVLLR